MATKKINKKYQKYFEETKHIADLLGIKLAPIDEVLKVYPDEFLGWEFMEAQKTAKDNLSKYTQNKLIKAFRSHEWIKYTDIYGHNGLQNGWRCKICKHKVNLPGRDYNKENKCYEFSDEFILAYHLVYGQHKRFGGRITRCTNKGFR